MIPIIPKKSEKTEFQDNELVCYCFEYTRIDIEKDFRSLGYSSILEKIKTEKKANGCSCEVKNPQGI